MMRLKAVLVWLSGLLLMSVLLSGCSTKLISDYDERSIVQLEMIDKKINRMYLTMQYQPEKERTYAQFQSNYLDIDVDIRSYQRRQQVRDMNNESRKQADILADLWQQDMQTHKQKNILSDFIIKRRKAQYQRLISTMIEAEMAKK